MYGTQENAKADIVEKQFEDLTTTETKKTKRWKKGTPQEWTNFNQTVKTKSNELEPQWKTYHNLEKIITTSMQECIGQTTITNSNKHRIKNDQIKEA